MDVLRTVLKDFRVLRKPDFFGGMVSWHIVSHLNKLLGFRFILPGPGEAFVSLPWPSYLGTVLIMHALGKVAHGDIDRPKERMNL